MDIKKVNAGIPYVESPAVEGGVDYKTEAARLKKVIASTCERLPSYEDSAALARRVRIFGEAGVRTKSPSVEKHVVGALEDAVVCGGGRFGRIHWDSLWLPSPRHRGTRMDFSAPY